MALSPEGQTCFSKFSGRNTIKFLGVIALAAIIGFSMTACGDDDGGGGGKFPTEMQGTWKMSSVTMVITETTLTMPVYESTYSIKSISGNLSSGWDMVLDSGGGYRPSFNAKITGSTMVIDKANYFVGTWTKQP
jgi:hypothetical protein